MLEIGLVFSLLLLVDVAVKLIIRRREESLRQTISQVKE
jgi:hypothetical protein